MIKLKNILNEVVFGGSKSIKKYRIQQSHIKRAEDLLKNIRSVDGVIPHKDSKGLIMFVNYTNYGDRAKIKRALDGVNLTSNVTHRYDNDGRSTNAPRGIMGLGGANWMSFIKEGKMNERFEFEKGDEYQVQGKTNSMQEFVKHIKNLPEELGSIKVTNSTLSFTDSSHDVEFKKKFTSADKAKVIKIIRDLSIEFKKKKDPVYEYELRSFYGTLGKRTPAENNYYITMRTKAKDDFGAAMSRGDHGPLD